MIDIEVPTDHGIYGALYRVAIKHDIKFILGGNNIATEGIMPKGWNYYKWDHINLLDIYRQFGTRKLHTYPLFNRRLKKQAHTRGIELVEILDLIEYSRQEAVNTITTKFGWRDYGIKHGESIFTKFYQEYLLPKKFGIDKRKAHLSTLINTGEITRDTAIAQLEESRTSEAELNRNKEYVLKKLRFSDDEFAAILRHSPTPHTAFETEGSLFYEFRFLLPFRDLWIRSRDQLGIKHRGRSKGLEIR